MKRFICLVIGLAIALTLQAQVPNVEILRMTKENVSGNQRYPVVCENLNGERMYTYRGGDIRTHYYYYKDGKWGGGAVIPNSPKFSKYMYSDIVADSKGTFHFVCEEGGKALYYAYFKNGAWSNMKKLGIRHEVSLALGVRSDDTIVLVSAFVTNSGGGLTKDVILGTKLERATQFSNFTNITRDRPANTMIDLAIDASANTWISYKMEFPYGDRDILDTILHGVNKSNHEFFWENVSDQTGWTWFSQVEINNQGKIMVTWMRSQLKSYFSRLYDPVTKEWTEEAEISLGPLRPWCTMYNKLLYRDSDFYWVGLRDDRYVVLYKYNAEANSWSFLANVSDAPATWCSAEIGADSLLVTWDSFKEPTACYLTTVSSIFPPPPIEVQSPINLAVERKFERSFFGGYSLNTLNWQANPVNIEEGITITAQNLYRKERTADSTQWTLITTLAADVYSYLDNHVPTDSDYVYAVTCVESGGKESPIVEPTSGQASEKTPVPMPKLTSLRSDRQGQLP